MAKLYPSIGGAADQRSVAELISESGGGGGGLVELLSVPSPNWSFTIDLQAWMAEGYTQFKFIGEIKSSNDTDRFLMKFRNIDSSFANTVNGYRHITVTSTSPYDAVPAVYVGGFMEVEIDDTRMTSIEVDFYISTISAGTNTAALTGTAYSKGDGLQVFGAIATGISYKVDGIMMQSAVAGFTADSKFKLYGVKS